MTNHHQVGVFRIQQNINVYIIGLKGEGISQKTYKHDPLTWTMVWELIA